MPPPLAQSPGEMLIVSTREPPLLGDPGIPHRAQSRSNSSRNFWQFRMLQRWVAYHIQPIAASSVNRAELPISFVLGRLSQGLHRHANHLR
jgi:hypothetical protein